MPNRTLLRSFAGGEITPEMYGRLDISKYQTGLSKSSNFLILPHGPASRRPGFEFVAETRFSAKRSRLLPFAFSDEETVVLEVGDTYLRFFLNGSALLEPNITVFSVAGDQVNTATPHGFAVGDGVFIGGRFLNVGAVVSTSAFKVVDQAGNPAAPTGFTVARVYTLASPYAEADLFNLHYAQDSSVLTICYNRKPAYELRRLSAASYTLTQVSFTPPTAPPAPSIARYKPTAGADEAQAYLYTYVTAEGVESLPSAVVSTANALQIAGNTNVVSWATVPGAARYNVYKMRGGVYGYMGSTTDLTVTDNNILPDVNKTPPEDVYTLNGGTTDYPNAVTYHEQRRWFAGTLGKPQTLWATRNGSSANLTSSLAVQDDDALEFKIGARQQNAIRHLLPLADLIALTVGGEFRIFSDNAPSITPTSLSVKPQGYTGASNVQPALTSSSILYVQSQGSRVRELAYSWESQVYRSIDVTIMAPHLFNGHTVVDMAYSRAPVQMLWCVRSDGALLAFTYVPEQQVSAWHQHHTDGAFESVTVVAEGGEDVLYVVVRRTVAGRQVRYIERLRSRDFVDQADAYFVDCGVTYRGAPVQTLSNLFHLEGRQVQILADGAVHPTRTVEDGQITLDYPASVVHIGLQYTSDLVTLPLSFEGAPASGQGFMKNVNSLAMRVSQSSLVRAGPTFDDLVDFPARDVEDPYGKPPALRSSELRFDISPDWNSDGTICVRQDQPLPLTVLSIGVDVAAGG